MPGKGKMFTKAQDKNQVRASRLQCKEKDGRRRGMGRLYIFTLQVESPR